MRDTNYVEEDWADGLKNRLRLDDAPIPFTSPQQSRSSATVDKDKALTSMADFEVARNATRSLGKLRDLPQTATLLLLTPVMVPVGFSDIRPSDSKPSKHSGKAPKGSSSQTGPFATDPFESLGKALNKYHSRIRHVPYVPSAGFTDTHDAFVMNAGGVIVLTCVPESSSGAAADIETTLAKEVEFVSNVANALEEAERDVPMVNFGIGGDDWMTEATRYNHIWAGEKYDADSVKNIVKLVFSR